MRFQLSEVFLTGIPHIDEDHRSLLERINAVAALERQDDAAALLDALAEFRADLDAHFRVEEGSLRELGYPRAKAHADHHADTLAALARLTSNVRQGRKNGDEVASFCFHELVTAILQRDMEFANWLADHPEIERRVKGS